MKNLRKTSLMMFLAVVLMVVSSVKVYATPESALKTQILSGEYTYITNGKKLKFSTNKYTLKGGGTCYWNELFGSNAASTSGYSSVVQGSDGSKQDTFFSETFVNLKPKAKQNFLGDVFTIANAMANDTANGYSRGADAVTDDTVQDFMRYIQDESGMGSQLLASLLQNTKPDYVSANRIYAPFSGVVGTILGVISVFIMALLGITMALDIAFITIPAFQLVMGADGSGEQGKDSANKMSRLISSEARQAVQANSDSNGSGGQSGQDKQALGIYFKKRWKSLVLLGICLLYLVQGQIYSLVAWIIDLLSGFLGF